MTSSTTRQKTDLVKYSLTVGIAAMAGRGFYYPTDTVIGTNGRLYVINRTMEGGGHRVRVTMCDLDSEFFGMFGYYGDGDGQFIWPMCGAFDSQGRLYISDEHVHRISVFDSEGIFLSKWGVHGSGEGELDGPSGIAVDGDGDIYVSDTFNHRIQKFTSSGSLKLTFGTKGNDDGQLDLPWGVTIAPNGDVYVADWGNDRIQRFSPDGEFIAKYGSSGRGDGELQRPSSVAVDENGYIYVADWGNERVQILDSKGGFVQILRGEATLSKWAEEFMKGNTEEAESRARSNLESVPYFVSGNPHEESSLIEKYFWSPMSVKLDASGRLYVTESNRHRIQVYEPAG